MNWSVKQSNNAQSEIASANYPQIRLFKVAQKVSHYPLDDVEGFWSSANSDTVGDFSAVGYFFARYLHGHLRVPVGVVQTAWGGTPAESWTSLPALATDPALLPHLGEWANTLAAYPQARIRYEAALKEWEKTKQGRRPQPPQGPEHQWMPGGLYNAMIAPLTPFAIRGAIWYQGESNTGAVRAPLYGRLFQTMIQDWRARWAQGDFPFLFVQLANYGKTGANSMWPQVREAQLETLALRHTGMAVTIDIGDPGDIHPTNKQDVGKRLGLGARSAAYGEKLVYSGPVYRQMAREGNAIRLWFDHAPSLVAKNGALQGFTIAGADRKFLAAEARIEGNTVVVTSTSVPNPAAVRYAWADAPECNLYNGEGLPASPFRTDRW
jgi:sialate O-acetylesterase